MGRSLIYRVKKEDFPHVAHRLGISLTGRSEDVRGTLTEKYSPTGSFRVTLPEGEGLITGLSLDDMQ